MSFFGSWYMFRIGVVEGEAIKSWAAELTFGNVLGKLLFYGDVSVPDGGPNGDGRVSKVIRSSERWNIVHMYSYGEISTKIRKSFAG